MKKADVAHVVEDGGLEPGPFITKSCCICLPVLFVHLFVHSRARGLEPPLKEQPAPFSAHRCSRVPVQDVKGAWRLSSLLRD